MGVTLEHWIFRGRAPTHRFPLLRDGVALSPVWSPLEGYSFNARSGLVGYAAVQYCDCDAVLGSPGLYASIITRHGGLDSHEGFLPKPFPAAELSRKVRQALTR